MPREGFGRATSVFQLFVLIKHQTVDINVGIFIAKLFSSMPYTIYLYNINFMLFTGIWVYVSNSEDIILLHTFIFEIFKSLYELNSSAIHVPVTAYTSIASFFFKANFITSLK
jgi:hypothetical protein